MKTKVALFLGCVLVAPMMLTALVMEMGRGEWPASWPKELESFRSQARTIEFAAGNQENIYEIGFTDRAEFERIWPVILQLKTPGAPISLYSTNNADTTFFHNNHAAVRIWAPPGGGALYPNSLLVSLPPTNNNDRITQLMKEGKLHELRAEPPWPADIVSTNGELPEYVAAKEENGTMRWVSAMVDGRPTGFYYRARVDLDLVVDGKIIDLNSIQFPSNAPIHDRRFEK